MINRRLSTFKGKRTSFTNCVENISLALHDVNSTRKYFLIELAAAGQILSTYQFAGTYACTDVQLLFSCACIQLVM